MDNHPARAMNQSPLNVVLSLILICNLICDNFITKVLNRIEKLCEREYT